MGTWSHVRRGFLSEKMTFEKKCGRNQSDTGTYLGEEAKGTAASVKL